MCDISHYLNTIAANSGVGNEEPKNKVPSTSQTYDDGRADQPSPDQATMCQVYETVSFVGKEIKAEKYTVECDKKPPGSIPEQCP